MNPPAASDRLTILDVELRKHTCDRLLELWPLIPAVGEHFAQEREPAEQRRNQQNAAIAFLDIGRMNDGMKHQANRIDEDMRFLPLIFLPAS